MCVKVATMGDKSDPGKADTEVSILNIAKTDFQTQRPVLARDGPGCFVPACTLHAMK